jgi:hypothetical protein
MKVFSACIHKHIRFRFDTHTHNTPGLAMLEVFNAGILDALAFLATALGLTFSLGFYPG